VRPPNAATGEFSAVGGILYPSRIPLRTSRIGWPFGRAIVGHDALVLTPRGFLTQLKRPIAIPYEEISAVEIRGSGFTTMLRFRSDNRRFDRLSFAMWQGGIEKLADALDDKGLEFRLESAPE
jgi:hypothetical protein